MAESKTRERIPEPDMGSVALSVGNADASRRVQRKAAARSPKERGKVQKAFDKLVEQAYDKWVKAGSPQDFDKRPLGHAKVKTTADQRETQEKSVRTVIRKGGVYHDLSIRFGTTEVEDKGDGTLVIDIAFSATDRPVKNEDDEPETTENQE